jgi:hypothetical protein
MTSPRVVLLALLALIAGTAATPAPPARNSGPPLFSDDFTDSANHAWSFDRDSVWAVSGGRLRATLPHERQTWSFAKVGSADWKDYAVDLDVCGVRGVDKGVVVRAEGAKRGVGVDLRSAPYDDVLLYRGFEHWGRSALPHKNGAWVHLRVEVRHNRYRVFANGRLAIDFTDESNSRPKGAVGLAAYTGGAGECEVLFDNVVVRALK